MKNVFNSKCRAACRRQNKQAIGSNKDGPRRGNNRSWSENETA